MPGKGTTMRGVRVPDEVWLPALAVARRRGENLSDVIRQALSEYATTPPPERERAAGD